MDDEHLDQALRDARVLRPGKVLPSAEVLGTELGALDRHIKRLLFLASRCPPEGGVAGGDIGTYAELGEYVSSLSPFQLKAIVGMLAMDLAHFGGPP